MLRRAATGVGVALGTGTLGLLGAAWVCATELLEPSRAGDPYTLKALAVDAATVTLPATPETRDANLCTLQWPGGYGLLGATATAGPATVRRSLTERVGVPLEAGTRTRVKRHTYEGDPRRAFGFDFEEIEVPTPLGPMPAWLVPAGGPGPWAVIVHGRGGTRTGMLRLLPELHARGMTSLVVTYRNDPGAPRSPDGLFHLGDSEWLDVEAAVHEARTRGAREVVAFGDSMGGAIVMAFLERSPLAASVTGVVLDSPVLDWGPVLAMAGERHRLPPIVLSLAKRLARLRAGISWRRLDQVSRASDLAVPVLVIHGDADDTVPVSTSRAYAAARPDLVTFVEVPGAGHVEGWTTDPPACGRALRAFLDRLG